MFRLSLEGTTIWYIFMVESWLTVLWQRGRDLTGKNDWQPTLASDRARSDATVECIGREHANLVNSMDWSTVRVV